MRLLVDRVDYSYLGRNSVKIVSRKEDLFNGRHAYDIWVDVSDQVVSPEWYQNYEEIRRFYAKTYKGRRYVVPAVMQHPGHWKLVVSHLEVDDVLFAFAPLEPISEILAKLADKYWAKAEALLLAHLSVNDRENKAAVKRL